MSFEFSQVVAKLVKTVGFFGKLKTLENDLVNVLGAPGAEIVATMQQNLQEPDDTRLVDLYPGIVDRPCGDRQGDALQQREVDVDVQPLAYHQAAVGCVVDNRDSTDIHHSRCVADQAFIEVKAGAFCIVRNSVERNLLLVLNRIKQLSQVNSCFSQLHLDPGDFRANISTWELYLDSFNAAVFSELRIPELNAVVGTDRYNL